MTWASLLGALTRIFTPSDQPPSAERTQNQKVIKRANQAADTWNERTKKNWEMDGHHAR